MPAEVWAGNESLRALLVPIDSLTPHPRNPRTHDVKAIRESLDAFGQQRPVLVLAADFDGLPAGTIVAGHGTVKGARENNWTHVAAVPSDLTGDEIERYLLADNRTGDLGGYDEAQLAAIVEELAEKGKLYGTGYTEDDLDDMIATANLAAEEAIGDMEDEADPPPREPRTDERTVALVLASSEFRPFSMRVRVLAREYGTSGVSETVVRAVEQEFNRVWSALPEDEKQAAEEDPGDEA